MPALGVNAHASVTVGLFGLPLVLPEIERHFGVPMLVAGSSPTPRPTASWSPSSPGERSPTGTASG